MSEDDFIGHKIRIYPNKTMQKQFEEWFNYSRYSYNISLDIWNKMYEQGLKANGTKVRDEYKRNQKPSWDTFPPNIFDNACEALAKGWDMFFEGHNDKPKFKSKRKAKKSFTINRKNNSTIRIRGDRLYIPNVKYGIKMAESLRFEGRVKLCTISLRAGQYFASFSIDFKDQKEEIYHSSPLLPSVGIDANIGHFDMVDSNQEFIRFESPLAKLEVLYKRVDAYQRQLSKKKYNSNNYNAVKIKLQRTYLRIQNIQDNWLHHVTTFSVYNYHIIGIEDLNVKGMLKNRRLAKKIAKSLFGRFKTQINYKSKMYGNKLVTADKWFASTQTCSQCGHKKEADEKLTLSDRIYKCHNCGEVMDRDANAANNLRIYAEKRAG